MTMVKTFKSESLPLYASITLCAPMRKNVISPYLKGSANQRQRDVGCATAQLIFRRNKRRSAHALVNRIGEHYESN